MLLLQVFSEAVLTRKGYRRLDDNEGFIASLSGLPPHPVANLPGTLYQVQLLKTASAMSSMRSIVHTHVYSSQPSFSYFAYKAAQNAHGHIRSLCYMAGRQAQL